MLRTLPVLVVVPVSLLGCVDPCGLGSCEGGYSEVQGSPDQFTAGPVEEDHVSVAAPVTCEPWDDPEATGHVVAVEVSGGTEDDSWWTDRFLPELRAAGLGFGWGAAVCADEGLSISLGDWADANTVVDIGVGLATEDDIQVDFLVEIVPQPYACADVACGI